MSIFNSNKSKNDTRPDVSLTDYERKLRERQEEYNHLNTILRGMRAEVSNLMEEIKNVTDNLVKKNAELFLLEQSIEDLKRSYELLKQDIKYEEETFNKVNGELTKIKNELDENIPFYEKLEAVKKEYELVSLQLIARKAEFEITNNPDNIIPDVPSLDKLENNLEIPNTAQKHKCKAKTKSGSKCKRYAIEGSSFCSLHYANINSN